MNQEFIFLAMIVGCILLATISLIAVVFLRIEISRLREEKAGLFQLAEFGRRFEQRVTRLEEELRYESEPRRPERRRDDYRSPVEASEPRGRPGAVDHPSILRRSDAQPSSGIQVPPDRGDPEGLSGLRQPVPPSRQDSLTALLEMASQALDSAANFNAFAEHVKGVAYCVGAGGQATLEQAPSPDRGDILVFSHDLRRVAVPGFNVRRNLPHYSGDAGRVAQARFQWLFDIERGDRLQAPQPAFVDADLRVQQKGRLLLPFDQG